MSLEWLVSRGMRRARWLAEWRNSETKPVFYHCVSRVVERRFAFGADEKEKFRTIMRMMERFRVAGLFPTA